MKKILVASLAASMLVVGIVWWSDRSSEFISSAQASEVIVYKSPTCGCCGAYVSYLKKHGFKVDVRETANMNEIKSQYGVPSQLESCHTSVIGDYIIEGHMPLEAIEKLLTERPDITGISLPEMPAGSPGMGGTKISPFRIHLITKGGRDGGIFMKL